MSPRTMVQQNLLKNLTSCVKYRKTKKCDAMEIGEERDMLREQLKDLQQNFNEER